MSVWIDLDLDYFHPTEDGEPDRLELLTTWFAKLPKTAKVKVMVSHKDVVKVVKEGEFEEVLHIDAHHDLYRYHLNLTDGNFFFHLPDSVTYKKFTWLYSIFTKKGYSHVFGDWDRGKRELSTRMNCLVTRTTKQKKVLQILPRTSLVTIALSPDYWEGPGGSFLELIEHLRSLPHKRRVLVPVLNNFTEPYPSVPLNWNKVSSWTKRRCKNANA